MTSNTSIPAPLRAAIQRAIETDPAAAALMVAAKEAAASPSLECNRCEAAAWELACISHPRRGREWSCTLVGCSKGLALPTLPGEPFVQEVHICSQRPAAGDAWNEIPGTTSAHAGGQTEREQLHARKRQEQDCG